MSTPPLEYESKSTRPARREADYYLLIIRGAAFYLLASALTLPFTASIWVGKIPLLALVQLPKVELAHWLIRHAAMPTIRMLGLSRGSFSPDYLLAKPYALAAAYLIPLGILLLIVWMRTRLRRRLLIWAVVLLIVAAIDFCYTLKFAEAPGLTIY